MTSLLNLTLVVIGSWAETKAEGRRQKAAKSRNAETRRRNDAMRNDPPKLVAPSPCRPVAVSRQFFISIGPTQPDGLNRPLDSNVMF